MHGSCCAMVIVSSCVIPKPCSRCLVALLPCPLVGGFLYCFSHPCFRLRTTCCPLTINVVPFGPLCLFPIRLSLLHPWSQNKNYISLTISFTIYLPLWFRLENTILITSSATLFFKSPRSYSCPILLSHPERQPFHAPIPLKLYSPQE